MVSSDLLQTSILYIQLPTSLPYIYFSVKPMTSRSIDFKLFIYMVLHLLTSGHVG